MNQSGNTVNLSKIPAITWFWRIYLSLSETRITLLGPACHAKTQSRLRNKIHSTSDNTLLITYALNTLKQTSVTLRAIA